MQVKNDYDIILYDQEHEPVSKGVFNGEVGVVSAIQSGTVTVNFDGRFADYPLESLGELDLSYATTIHKAQGSEYEVVIIPMLPAHKILLSRNLFYTGITRARRRVILVGHKKALYMAIGKSSNGRRNTLLGERITLYQRALTHKAAQTGETALKLDLPYKRLWFRLACPDGRMLLNPLRITDQMAIFEARIYAGRDDASLISSFTATQTVKDGPEYIRAAQDEALNEALDNAGFGIQLCDMPQMPDSGEAIPDTSQEQPSPEPPAEETAPAAPAAQPPTQPPQQPEAAPVPPVQEPAPQTASKVISMPAREQSPAPEPVAAPVAEAPAPQNEGEALAGEAAQEPPRYTADMTVEAIRELMTLDEAKAVVVPLGSCAGLTLGQVAEERKASLKWYLYAKTDNIVKAGAAMLLEELGLKKLG